MSVSTRSGSKWFVMLHDSGKLLVYDPRVADFWNPVVCVLPENIASNYSP